MRVRSAAPQWADRAPVRVAAERRVRGPVLHGRLLRRVYRQSVLAVRGQARQLVPVGDPIRHVGKVRQGSGGAGHEYKELYS